MKNLEQVVKTLNAIFDGDMSRAQAINELMSLGLNRTESDSVLQHKVDSLLIELIKLLVEVKQELKDTDCIHTINYLNGKKAILQFAIGVLK